MIATLEGIGADEFRARIERDGNLVAAQSVDPLIRNKRQADLYIFRYVTRLLNAELYGSAALVLWGPRVFNARPSAVRKIIKSIRSHAKLLIQGCGSVGKSYTAVVWLFLDWLRDPEFTNIKIISTTSGHAKSNTFSNLIKLHETACVKLPGMVTSDYVGLDSKKRHSGISVIAIPTGDDGKGRLQGFHPMPRAVVHPTLGPSSRVRALLDECEEIPLGVWEGIANMLVSMEGADTIKVIGAYNPKDQTSMTAKNAEPKDGGWEAFDIETGVRGKDEWESKNTWHVLRIDGKKTENVKLRKLLYPGFMTHTGFRELEVKDGGNSVNYYTFGRGAYPPEGAIGVLIGGKLINDARGEYVFVGAPIRAAGVDTALDGRDNCVLTVGRTGYASGFQPKSGKLVRYREPRMVLQVDQQFTLPKGDTKKMGDAIMTNCIKLGVSPEYCCIDATGNGSGVYSYLRAIWSEDVQGVDFNKAATEIKITEQDQCTPEELYEGVVSEVWFALAKWLEFGLCALSPGLRSDPLDGEVTRRRYVFGKLKKLRVEKKDDYKKRTEGNKSPDFADSLTILLHGVRMRDVIIGSMLEDDDKPHAPGGNAPQHDESAEVTWLEMDDGTRV